MRFSVVLKQIYMWYGIFLRLNYDVLLIQWTENNHKYVLAMQFAFYIWQYRAIKSKYKYYLLNSHILSKLHMKFVGFEERNKFWAYIEI